MRVGLFARNDHPPSAALAAGIVASGDEVEWYRGSVWKPSEAKRMHAIVLRGLHKAAEIVATYERLGVPILILELPVIRCVPDLDSWHSLFWGAINRYPPGCRVFEQRARYLESVTAQPEPLGDAREILILGQVGGDYAHGMSNDQLSEGYRNMSRRICERHPESPIRWRPHPKGRVFCDGYDYLGGEVPLRDEILRAREVHTVNSTAGLEAMLLGRPVHCHPSAPYYNWSGRSITCQAERLELLRHVSRVQWNLDDLATGHAWRYQRALIARARGVQAPPPSAAVYGNVASKEVH